MGKLEQALEFLDVEDWIEEYTEVKYGGNNEIRIQECPKCLNDKWKVYINTEKRTWFCQRCQWGIGQADVCVLLAEVADRNIHDVRIELMNTVVPSVADEQFMDELTKRMDNSPAVEEFNIDPVDLPGELGLSGVLGGKATTYLHSRGLTDEDIEYYQLRMANKLRNITGPWATFPVLYYGIPVGFQGRKFLNNIEPRYLSSDNIANWMWPLDETNVVNVEGKAVVLVEGVFDALAYIKAGIPALCTFGKNLSRSQIKLLQAHKVKDLYLSYDADAHKDIQKAADRMGHLFHTYIIELPPLPDNPKADPGDVLSGKIDKEWLTAAFEDAIDTRTPEYWNWKLRKELGE